MSFSFTLLGGLLRSDYVSVKKGSAMRAPEKESTSRDFSGFRTAQLVAVASEIGVGDGHQIFLDIVSGRNQVQQVHRGYARAPGVVERAAGFAGEADQVGVRQRDGLLGARPALF